MGYTDDLNLRVMTPGDTHADWTTDLFVNAATLDAKFPTIMARPHNLPVGTPSGSLVYEDPSSSQVELAIHDVTNIEKSRCIGITIEAIRSGISNVRIVSLGRAPFSHGFLTYGTKLYLPSGVDGTAGVLTTAATSGIVLARAARGNWVFFYPSFDVSLA